MCATPDLRTQSAIAYVATCHTTRLSGEPRDSVLVQSRPTLANPILAIVFGQPILANPFLAIIKGQWLVVFLANPFCANPFFLCVVVVGFGVGKCSVLFVFACLLCVCVCVVCVLCVSVFLCCCVLWCCCVVVIVVVVCVCVVGVCRASPLDPLRRTGHPSLAKPTLANFSVLVF